MFNHKDIFIKLTIFLALIIILASFSERYVSSEELPQKNNTVLIFADEEYITANPDWQEQTKRLIKEGTKDFKDKFNMKFIPIRSEIWQSKGANHEEITHDLWSFYYNDYMKNKMQGSDNFDFIIGFTKDNNFNEFPERILLPQACEGRSPTVGGR